jgi:hypothetical protein
MKTLSCQCRSNYLELFPGAILSPPGISFALEPLMLPGCLVKLACLCKRC